MRVKLLLRGISPNKCVAAGPVKLDLNSKAIITLGRNVFFRGNCELKIRDNGQIVLGDDVRLDFGVRITVASDYNVTLESAVEIGYCSLVNCGEDILVGQGSAISGHCILQSSEHIVQKNQDTTIMDGSYRRGKIIIGKRSWLASFVLVRPNVKLGDNCVIGAFSIVDKDVGQGKLVMGLPVRIITDL